MNEIKIVIDKYLKKKIDNSTLIQMYYEVGCIIKDNDLNLTELELFLKHTYGLVIAFTKRNLLNMVKLSNQDTNTISKLKKITWKNCLVLLNGHLDLIDLVIEYNPTKQELLNYIKENKIFVKNEFLEHDDTLEEMIELSKMYD